MTAKKSPSKKTAAAPVATPASPWPEERPADAEEIELRLQHLDYAAECRWTALHADPTGNLRDKDPELVDMLSESLRRRSIGANTQDAECGLLILNRIRNGTPEELKNMFAIITRMKRHAATKSASAKRNALVLPLWGPFLMDYLKRHGYAPTLLEFAYHVVEVTEGSSVKYPKPSCEPAWTPIWKAVGLTHRAARPGKKV